MQVLYFLALLRLMYLSYRDRIVVVQWDGVEARFVRGDGWWRKTGCGLTFDCQGCATAERIGIGRDDKTLGGRVQLSVFMGAYILRPDVRCPRLRSLE